MGSYGGKPPGTASETPFSEAPLSGAPFSGELSSEALAPGSGAPVSEALVSVALAELRQLAREPFFADVERALLALGQGAEAHAGSSLDAVRQLQQRSAGYQRAALGLEAAARCCRLVEREINQHADAILTENNKGLAGQFRDIFRRTRSAARNPARRQEPVPGSPRPEPGASADSRPEPGASADSWPEPSA